MAEIVRRRSWGGVLPLGRHASISGSSLIQCASGSIALSSFQEGQNARHHNQFKLEQALAAVLFMSWLARPWDVQSPTNRGTASGRLLAAQHTRFAMQKPPVGGGWSVPPNRATRTA